MYTGLLLKTNETSKQYPFYRPKWIFKMIFSISNESESEHILMSQKSNQRFQFYFDLIIIYFGSGALLSDIYFGPGSSCNLKYSSEHIYGYYSYLNFHIFDDKFDIYVSFRFGPCLISIVNIRKLNFHLTFHIILFTRHCPSNLSSILLHKIDKI